MAPRSPSPAPNVASRSSWPPEPGRPCDLVVSASCLCRPRRAAHLLTMPPTPPRTRAPLTAASGRQAGPSLHPPHRPHPAGERLCPRGTQVGAPPAAGQAARTLACLALAPTPPPLPPWSSGAPSPGPLLGLQPPRAASTVPSAAPPAFREARSPARGPPGGSQSISVQRRGPGPPRPPGSPSPSRPRTHGAALSPPSPRRTRALHRQPRVPASPTPAVAAARRPGRRERTRVCRQTSWQPGPSSPAVLRAKTVADAVQHQRWQPPHSQRPGPWHAVGHVVV